MEYDNTNTLAIFKNKNKTHEKAPDYTGRINIDGVDKALSIWLRESKSGEKYMSGLVSDPWNPNNQQQNQSQQKKAPVSTEDIPF